MAYIHNLLELSPRHLPAHLTDTLANLPGLAAESTAYGTLVKVPDAPVTRRTRGLPAEVAAVLSYARDWDCDYILVDPSFDTDDTLPRYDT